MIPLEEKLFKKNCVNQKVKLRELNSSLFAWTVQFIWGGVKYEMI